MIAVHLPPCPTVSAALDWLARHGVVLRACLERGPDGLIRGTGLVRARAA